MYKGATMAEYFVMKNTSLKRYNTLRLDVIAENVILPYTVEGLVEALKDFEDKKIVMIGNGSNILFTKEMYDDNYAFIITILLNDISLEHNEIVVEAGTRLHRLAWFACEQSIGELSFLEDIPGTVGGALIMNAGQWQFSIGQYVNWIDVFNYETKEVIRLSPDKDFFGYRYSRINDMPVYVLKASLKTQPGNYNEALELILKYRHERYVKQPRNYANAGSVFKRPEDKEGNSLFVWKLFDEVNLRGFKIGDAMVSDKHPGFIVNTGQATVQEMWAVVNECIKRVKENFDVDLELEWRVIN